jgi:hypothetical protein
MDQDGRAASSRLDLDSRKFLSPPLLLLNGVPGGGLVKPDNRE